MNPTVGETIEELSELSLFNIMGKMQERVIFNRFVLIAEILGGLLQLFVFHRDRSLLTSLYWLLALLNMLFMERAVFVSITQQIP